MTKDDVMKIEQEQYNLISRRRQMDQMKLDAYYKGLDEGLSVMSKVICGQLEMEERNAEKSE